MYVGKSIALIWSWVSGIQSTVQYEFPLGPEAIANSVQTQPPDLKQRWDVKVITTSLYMSVSG